MHRSGIGDLNEMTNSGRLMLPIAGWMVGGGLTAYGMLGAHPRGYFFETLVGAIGWVVGGLSWAWALSEGHIRWQGWRVLGVGASWLLASLVAAYFVWWMSATDVIFPPFVWVLGFVLGGAIGGFLTGMTLAIPPARACALAVVPAAGLGAAAYPGILASYFLLQISIMLIGSTLGSSFAGVLGCVVGGAVVGAFVGLILALPFASPRVRESFFQDG